MAPDVCGSLKGSSPRMRGARLQGRRPKSLTRIIPAYAGSTCRKGSSYLIIADHPRVCGEHWFDALEGDSVTGSSPRMRGAREAEYGTYGSMRIIPAYAGSTSIVLTRQTMVRDHPRVCGEHEIIQHKSVIQKGSSPRMRGARLCQAYRCLYGRIIPAYAGSTKCLTVIKRALKDHPRVCGEHYMLETGY